MFNIYRMLFLTLKKVQNRSLVSLHPSKKISPAKFPIPPTEWGEFPSHHLTLFGKACSIEDSRQGNKVVFYKWI